MFRPLGSPGDAAPQSLPGHTSAASTASNDGSVLPSGRCSRSRSDRLARLPDPSPVLSQSDADDQCRSLAFARSTPATTPSSLSHHLCEALGQLIDRCHRLIQVLELRQVGLFFAREVARTTERQACHVTSGWHRCGTLTCARTPWTLGSFITTELSDESTNHAGSVRVALCPDLTPQFHAVVTAFLPALQQVGNVGIKSGLPSGGLPAFRRLLQLAVAVDRLAANPDPASNVCHISTGQIQTADRLISLRDPLMPLLTSFLSLVRSPTWTVGHDRSRGEINHRFSRFRRTMDTLCRGAQHTPFAQ